MPGEGAVAGRELEEEWKKGRENAIRGSVGGSWSAYKLRSGWSRRARQQFQQGERHYK